MTPHPDTTIFKTPLADCWLESGTLCIASNDQPRNPANLKLHYQIVKGIVKKKVNWLMDLKTCEEYSKDAEALIDRELPKVCSAIAVIATRSCEKKVAASFLKFANYGIPVEVFENEGVAKAWLKKAGQKNR